MLHHRGARPCQHAEKANLHLLQVDICKRGYVKFGDIHTFSFSQTHESVKSYHFFSKLEIRPVTENVKS